MRSQPRPVAAWGASICGAALLTVCLLWRPPLGLAEGVWNDNEDGPVDLKIQAVRVDANTTDPRSFLAGRETDTCLALSNDGESPIYKLRVFFEADGVIVRTRDVEEPLWPSTSYWWCDDHVMFPSNTQLASAVAYPEDLSRDIDLSNNHIITPAVKFSNSPLADAYVGPPRMPEYPEDMYTLRRGDPVQICTVVGNHGEADLRGAELRFEWDAGDYSETLRSWRIDGMSPNDSADYCAQVNIPTWSNSFIAEVDLVDWSLEARPSDNKVQYYFRSGSTFGGSDPENEQESSAKPDLVVTRIQLDVDTCRPGRNRVLVTVVNEGEGRSPRSAVGLGIEGGEVLSKSIGRLKPGEGQDVRFDRVELSAGPHNMWAISDHDGKIDEISELNNEGTWSVRCTAALPDLEVDSIRLENDDCKAGKNRVTAKVRNGGDGPAERSLLRLSVNNTEVDTEEIDEIRPDDDVRVRFNGVELGAGDQTLRVQADVRNTLEESNEGNNSLAVGFTCSTAPQRNR